MVEGVFIDEKAHEKRREKHREQERRNRVYNEPKGIIGAKRV